MDLRTVLKWLILGALVWIGLNLLGLLVNVAGALVHLGLRVGVVVLLVLIVIRVLEGLRGR